MGLSISTISLLQNYRHYLADIRYVWCEYRASWHTLILCHQKHQHDVSMKFSEAPILSLLCRDTKFCTFITEMKRPVARIKLSFEEDERRVSYYCSMTSDKPFRIIQIISQNCGPFVCAELKFHDYYFISFF